MSLIDRYKSILEKKQETVSAKTDNNSNSGPKIPYFNPKTALSNTDSYRVRVLPNPNGEMFFYEYKKHSFKVGNAFKQGICLSSSDRNGKSFGDCPICKFMATHKDLSKEAKKMGSNEFYCVLLWLYDEKKMVRYDQFGFLLSDLIKARMSLSDDGGSIDEFIDANGFDIYFELDEKGYVTISKASYNKKSLEDIEVNPDNLLDIVDLIKPDGNYVEYLTNVLKIGVKNLCPEYYGEFGDSGETEKPSKAPATGRGKSPVSKSATRRVAPPVKEEEDEDEEDDLFVEPDVSEDDGSVEVEEDTSGDVPMPGIEDEKPLPDKKNLKDFFKNKMN